MKKKVIIIVLLLIVVGIVYFVGSGFIEQKSVALRDFTVSEDGNEITMRVELNSSIGHVRSFKDKGGAEKPHYLHFYSAFGGINGSIGAKTEFSLKVGAEDDSVFFYQGDGGYKLVLKRNPETGVWERVVK